MKRIEQIQYKMIKIDNILYMMIKIKNKFKQICFLNVVNKQILKKNNKLLKQIIVLNK